MVERASGWCRCSHPGIFSARVPMALPRTARSPAPGACRRRCLSRRPELGQPPPRAARALRPTPRPAPRAPAAGLPAGAGAPTADAASRGARGRVAWAGPPETTVIFSPRAKLPPSSSWRDTFWGESAGFCVISSRAELAPSWCSGGGSATGGGRERAGRPPRCPARPSGLRAGSSLSVPLPTFFLFSSFCHRKSQNADSARLRFLQHLTSPGSLGEARVAGGRLEVPWVAGVWGQPSLSVLRGTTLRGGGVVSPMEGRQAIEAMASSAREYACVSPNHEASTVSSAPILSTDFMECTGRVVRAVSTEVATWWFACLFAFHLCSYGQAYRRHTLVPVFTLGRKGLKVASSSLKIKPCHLRCLGSPAALPVHRQPPRSCLTATRSSAATASWGAKEASPPQPGSLVPLSVREAHTR
nr:uncharacterized protein LOC108177059 [Oryctolagus cuniculus]